MILTDNLQIRELHKEDFYELFMAFNLAFYDYLIPISLSFDQFKNRFLHKLGINFELSAGAFYSNKLVGFIITTTGNYEGKKVAYNGGTGIIPEFRGMKLTMHLYNFLFPIFLKNDVEVCVLEVLTENEKAIHVYNKIGFEKNKFFHCYRKGVGIREHYENDFFSEIKVIDKPNWNLFKSFADMEPSFLDSFEVLPRNIRNEQIIVFEKENVVYGYAIYQPELGRISQLAVDRNNRRKGIGSALINYMMNNSETVALTAMNVNAKYPDLLYFLQKTGFENELDQYEMILSLS